MFLLKLLFFIEVVLEYIYIFFVFIRYVLNKLLIDFNLNFFYKVEIVFFFCYWEIYSCLIFVDFMGSFN